MDEAARGASALSSGDFPKAIAHYTNAITTNPQAVDYYIKRSTAHTRSSPANHTSALEDAETAVVLAKKRGKRESIAQAQLRRGIALFGLERWADARLCFGWVRKLNEKEASLGIWEKKIENKLNGLEDGDERAKVVIEEFPEVELPKAVETKKAEKKAIEPSDAKKPSAETVSEPRPEGVQTPANKIRHEWYQTAESIVVTLFAKNVPKDTSTIDLHPDSLSISFPLPTGSTFHFSVDPFFAEIDPSTSTTKIMSTKVEFTLKKSVPSQKWPSLESTESPPSTSDPENPDATATSTAPKATIPLKATPPAYPTSSKTGPKNWDKVAASLTKKPPKKQNPIPQSTTTNTDPTSNPPSITTASKAEEEEDDEDVDGIDEFEDGGDPVNGFFKQLYASSNPDTRRAMMKSYQESNGTALSTNWSEVGKGKVETSPPDGMVEKKWGD
ncbi:hypothetical protein MMC12_001289 [Toensbergia leucococca]|nr:hypothetical protein [Toensbergia leucococca]